MRAGRRRLIHCGLAVFLWAGSSSAAEAPVTVSPGTPAGGWIGDPCPTFSWGAAAGAKSYELVVYRLGEGEEEPQPVLRQQVPGSASSWSPALDRCLERGGRYAWLVGALGRDEHLEWSLPAVFQVAAGPSQLEFEAALTVVRRYLDSREEPNSTGDDPKEETDPEADPESADRDARTSPGPGAVGTTKLTVSGGVVATSFTGDGSTLTDLNPANLSAAVGLTLGGTGATDAAGARGNLGVAAADQSCPASQCVVAIDAAGALVCGSCNPQACGDGTLHVAEECDDGNNANGDGCSSTCVAEPPLEVLSATATDATHVEVVFDRSIDASTVLGDGSQFTFDLGLTATAASASGDTATVTTTAQSAGASYTVTVASTVEDPQEVGVSPLANSAAFSGFAPAAAVRINELNANITNGCDLIELRVMTTGTMDGLYLQERTDLVLTFTDFVVQAGDLIVVHFDSSDSNCNATASGNETSAKNEYANSSHSANYDTAWDWYSSDTGLASTDNVLTLYNDSDAILDAVFVSDDTTGTAAAATETQAAAVAGAGEWEMVGGGVPAGGFVDGDFNAHAVQDLDATGTDASGDSIQRSDDTDSNTTQGWTQTSSSWGALNTGQS